MCECEIDAVRIRSDEPHTPYSRKCATSDPAPLPHQITKNSVWLVPVSLWRICGRECPAFFVFPGQPSRLQ